MTDLRGPAGRDCTSNIVGWQHANRYDPLLEADGSSFAWEWLRRSPSYRRAWFDWEAGRRHHLSCREFGLERFEDPNLGAPVARVIWSAALDASVIQAKIIDPFAEEEDRVDLRLLSHMVTLVVDDEDIEHILLSDGLRHLRIDIVDGTLIGCPSALAYALQGLSRLRGPVAALHRLTRLVARRRFDPTPGHNRRERWILELRTADALAAHVPHQDIARALFGDIIPASRWRTDDSSYRQRVQRLVRTARKRLQSPLDSRWFA